MKSNSFIKSKIFVLFVIAGISIVFYAFSNGVTGKTKKNGDGCNCHGSASGSVITSITGPDQLTPGQTAEYTVTITGGPLSAAGTNIAVSSGTLSPAGNDLKLSDGELTHVSPKNSAGGSVVFKFNYTAPNTTGGQTLFANGNSVNKNGNSSGDAWSYAQNKTVTVVSATGVDEELSPNSFVLKQNYPNPFNPATNITYSVPSEGFVSLKVYDVLGREVATLVNEVKNAGVYSANFNAASVSEKLSSGTYIYELKFKDASGSKKDYSSVKKMILMQ